MYKHFLLHYFSIFISLWEKILFYTKRWSEIFFLGNYLYVESAH